MRRIFSPLVVGFVVLAALATQAQENTAHHRAVYAEINANQKSYRQTTATMTDEPLEFALTGYWDGGELRKIVAVSNEDGAGQEEFYLEKGKPLFVYNTYFESALSKKPVRVENRLYFQKGKIVQWLSTAKPAPEKSGYAAETDRLNGLCRAFIKALPRPDKTASPTQTAEGVFLGIEQGDYTHWKLRTSGGEETTYFVLRPEASVEKVVEHPEAYEGKKCRITWKKSTENLPEAGGKTEIEQVLGVEWMD